MSICYIVGAGDFFGKFEPCVDDLVIAADGGFDTLTKLGIRCDLLLGDMDSRQGGGEADNGVEILRYPVKKDETDTHLAYLEGVRRGYTDFCIYGGVGGREDHTFANYSLLLYAKNRGHNATLVGNRCKVFVIKNEHVTLSGRVGATISVFAFGGVAEGVCVSGATYEAKDISISPEFALGVSNSFLCGPVRLSVRSGALLVMVEE